jgi:mRNA-degrading endonuclease YafQ of YafQ-DinJ toxin-antitoxin module
MRIALAQQFVRQYKDLAATDQRACDAAVEALPAAFGHPHRHSGLGLRALRHGVYECRANQAVRLGFTRHGETLLLQTVGNHDTIRAWLRNHA